MDKGWNGEEELAIGNVSYSAANDHPTLFTYQQRYSPGETKYCFCLENIKHCNRRIILRNE